MRRGFVSTVSHELRTPLTSISGALGLVRSGSMGGLPDKVAVMVQIAYQNSERLIRIINDILDIGKIEAGALALRMVRMPLAALVQQSVEANASYAEKYGVRFRFDRSTADGQVMGDADRLMQVLSNLLSNAAKFSPRGADVLIRLVAGPGALRVEVEDSGAGIPEKFRARIFEPFAQADHSASRRFDGTGLGLCIARRLLEAMGGSIAFNSVVGEGTIFYFELPRIDAMPTGLIGTEIAEKADYAGPIAGAALEGAIAALPRILHVEDEADLVSVIREALAGQAEVVPANTLLEAQKLLSKGGFSLVVLDNSLPDGNGLELVDRIQNSPEHQIPIIILSAIDVPRDLHGKVAAVLMKSQVSTIHIAGIIASHLAPRS